MKNKKTIIINGKEYKEANTLFWDILGFFGCIAFLSWLLVGAVGTAVLSLLGLA